MKSLRNGVIDKKLTENDKSHFRDYANYLKNPTSIDDLFNFNNENESEQEDANNEKADSIDTETNDDHLLIIRVRWCSSI